MPVDQSSPFELWRAAQRRLHEVEREIAQAARHRQDGFPGRVPNDLLVRAHELRREVDRLMPAAMEDLDDRVRAAVEGRPTWTGP